ncbi:PREDICTED: protein root UVB sensitive 2, chloroplastic isoform X2 [Nelumbo nucifera]|uniref:Protein root UVB sensitive 2, chloroplastic isoform X2 n=1 Tax=Nelumbo nucifera TaxID=4432 RepID=A0A1U8A709_NELNU|nr:PREDICTED: protein root UVB sensitive 2, chloroplastic isoform X2 [Nelumbo nucifera]
MNLLAMIQPKKKEPDKESKGPDFWIETFNNVSRLYKFQADGRLSVKVVDESRPVIHKMVESFLNKFFPSGYPYRLATNPCTGDSCKLADVLYDLGTGLEVLSPLCPQLFLEMAGLGNFAKGMAVVAARATRLPIYSSFAKEGNLSDLFAKGEAISTLFNVVGLGVGIQLASTVCSSMQGKLLVGPLLSVLHIYSVAEEIRAAPVNTLNPQRTAMVVADFLKTGNVSSPADLRYREDLLFPERVIEDAGRVKVGRALRKVVKPSKFNELREMFPEEKFLISRGSKWTDMVLEHSATGEDALRGWLVAGYAAEMEKSGHGLSDVVLQEAYVKMDKLFPSFLSELKIKGWHTDRFLDGTGSRFAL